MVTWQYAGLQYSTNRALGNLARNGVLYTLRNKVSRLLVYKKKTRNGPPKGRDAACYYTSWSNYVRHCFPRDWEPFQEAADNEWSRIGKPFAQQPRGVEVSSKTPPQSSSGPRNTHSPPRPRDGNPLALAENQYRTRAYQPASIFPTLPSRPPDLEPWPPDRTAARLAMGHGTLALLQNVVLSE